MTGKRTLKLRSLVVESSGGRLAMNSLGFSSKFGGTLMVDGVEKWVASYDVESPLYPGAMSRHDLGIVMELLAEAGVWHRLDVREETVGYYDYPGLSWSKDW